MLEIYKTTTEYNIYTDGNKRLRSDVIYYVEDSGAVHFFTNNVDGKAKVYNAYTEGGGGGIIPYGNIVLSENGTGFDVSTYATASVNVPVPSGYILPKGVYVVTDNSPEIDVSAYAYVSVDVPVPQGYIIPAGNIDLIENTQEIDVSEYATATVNVAGGGFTPSGDVEITHNGNDIDVYTYATATVAVPLDPSIRSITISDGTTEIGDNAFTGSEGLEEVVLPDTIEEIGDNAFDDCPNLDTVTVNADNPPALGEDSFSKDNTPDIFVPYDSLQDYIEEWSDYAEHIFPISSDYSISISSESITPDMNDDYEALIGEIMSNLIGYDSSWMPTAMISVYDNATGNGVVEEMPYNNPSLSDQTALNNTVSLMQQNQYDVYVRIDNTTHNGTAYNEGTYHFYAGFGEVKYDVSFKGDIEIENDDPTSVDVNNLISAIQDNIDGYDPSWMDEASVIIEDSDYTQLASISDIYNPTQNETDALQAAIDNVSLNDVWTINLYLPQAEHDGITYESLNESCNAEFKNVTVTRGEVWMKATVYVNNAGKARVLGWSDNLLYDGRKYWSYIKINGSDPISTYYGTTEQDHSMHKNTLPYLADGLEPNSYVEVEYKSSYWSDDDNASGDVIITVGNDSGIGGLRGTSICYFNEIPSYFTKISTYGLTGCTTYMNKDLTLEGITYVRDRAFYSNAIKTVYLPDIVEIGEEAFYNGIGHDIYYPKTGYIILGENCERIRPRAFYEPGYGSCYIYSYAVTPPSLNAYTFRVKSRVKGIYVPSEAVEDYKQAPNWDAFASYIQAME